MFFNRLKEKIEHKIEDFLYIIFFGFLTILLLFFILYSWYDAFQKWCFYWFSNDNEESKFYISQEKRNEIYTVAVSNTVFAVGLTLVLVIIILALRP